MKRMRFAAAAAAAMVLAGCGVLKSPADGLTFRAPAGWTGTPGIMGRFQLWTGGSGDKSHQQVLMLMKLPADVKLDKSFDPREIETNSATSLRDATLVSERTMKLCGTQESMFVKMQGKSKTGSVEEAIEMVLSKAPDGTYMAMYVHPVDSDSNPEAEGAIYQLCPAKS
jgi:hypothetical protein